MSLAEWWNRTRYRFYAPIYDVVARPLEAGHRRAIELNSDDRILILGSGPGVDLDYLPGGARVTAIDAAPEMVKRTAEKADELGGTLPLLRPHPAAGAHRRAGRPGDHTPGICARGTYTIATVRHGAAG